MYDLDLLLSNYGFPNPSQESYMAPQRLTNRLNAERPTSGPVKA